MKIVFFNKYLFLLSIIYSGDVYANPVGLENLGNTCYMNSVLQILAHTEDFKNYFLNNNFDKEKQQLSQAFKKFLESYDKAHGAFSPKELRNVIRQNKRFQNFAKNRQQDAHEFLTFFLEALEKENENKKEFKCFKFKHSSITKCETCGYQNTNNQEDCWLNLKIDENKKKKIENIDYEDCCCNCCFEYYEIDLIFLLEDFFKKEVVNDYKCEECGEKGKPSKKPFFLSCPSYLILTINSNNNEDINGFNSLFINVPTELDLFKFISEENLNNVNGKYSLYGVIKHYGGFRSGHYIANIKVRNDWFICDDSRVSEIKNTIEEERKIYSRKICPQGTYMLFFKKIDDSFKKKSPDSLK